jgi:hypothetical protein
MNKLSSGIGLMTARLAFSMQPVAFLTTAERRNAMIRTFFMIVTIAALLVGAADAQDDFCSQCGCRGGPGYRGPDGQCVGWKALNRICGTPPTTRCTAEQVNSDKPTKPKAAPN